MKYQVKNIYKSFEDLLVLDDITIDFPANKTTCILGPSGCGKTTLLNIIAGILNRRRTDEHVNFLGTCIPDQLDDFPADGAPDDGIVDHHHPLAPHRLVNGVELDAHGGVPLPLCGLDKGATHVAVFDKPKAVGDA